MKSIRLFLVVFFFVFGLKCENLEKKEKPEIKNSKTEIRIGASLDLSSMLKKFNQGLIEGINLFIEKAKNESSINIKYIVYDDNWDKDKARANILKLLNEKKIDIIFNTIGSDPFEGYQDIVKDEKILMLFPRAFGTKYRTKDYKYIIHNFASVQNESSALVEYALKKLRAKKIAVVYQDETYSKDSFAGALEAIKKNKLEENKDYKVFMHKANQLELKECAKDILDYKPDTLLFLADPVATRILINNIKNINSSFFVNLHILGNSGLDDLQFREYLNKNINLKIITSQTTPNPAKSKIEIVEEYRDLIKKKNLEISIFSVESFINISIFAYICKELNYDISKEKIIKFIEDKKDQDWNFKGLTLHFNPETRELYNKVWINTGEDEWIEYKE